MLFKFSFGISMACALRTYKIYRKVAVKIVLASKSLLEIEKYCQTPLSSDLCLARL